MAALQAERNKQLARVSAARGGRDVFVYAANNGAAAAPTAIVYDDLLPFTEQLNNLKGDKLDFIIETPGGAGEVAEDMIHLLRSRYEEVAVIIPGWAKSAGTIMAMAGDEILMGAMSSHGTIDAQIIREGKVFSAHALLDGMDKIKAEVTKNGLNMAYVPMLQALSPGELQHAENAMNFSKRLVPKWLAEYKFKYWDKHSDGRAVTPEEKKVRAEEIANHLSDHSHWLTHGRSIKINDLRNMELKITDYSEDAELADALSRYYALLYMTFEQGIIKVFETPVSQIYRAAAAQLARPTRQGDNAVAAGSILGDLKCGKCGHVTKIQEDVGDELPLQNGAIRLPEGDKFVCSSCGSTIDIKKRRQELEVVKKQQRMA